MFDSTCKIITVLFAYPSIFLGHATSCDYNHNYEGDAIV